MTSITKTVLVAGKELLVTTPDEIIVLSTTGQVRDFVVDDDASFTVEETGNDAYPASSSWVAHGVEGCPDEPNAEES